MKYQFCMMHEKGARLPECWECTHTYSYRIVNRDGLSMSLVAKHNDGAVYQVLMAEGI